jgi:serine/threonine-protein kinase
MFGLLLVAFRWFRPQSLLPVNSAERLVWVVWIAYLAAIGSINVTQLVRGRDLAESYPIFAAMAGLGFLVMGGHVWGGGYIAGVAFLAIAPLMPFLTDMAPIAVGVLWAASLFAFGIHYRRRGLDRLNKAEGES